jgi:hypothetical protein
MNTGAITSTQTFYLLTMAAVPRNIRGLEVAEKWAHERDAKLG